MLKVSVVLATYNMNHLIWETLLNIKEQDYPYKEIIVYDDCSTDGTESAWWTKGIEGLRYIRGKANAGVGMAFNAAISAATGDVVVLMCADDLMANRSVLSDIMEIFKNRPDVDHVSRWYYQFVHGYPGPVRAWRGNDPYILANNPSGLAFRKLALSGCECSNRMFIETTYLVSQVLKKGGKYHILPYDAIAVRVHGSTSTQAGYWLKRRVSSPVRDQVEQGARGIATDYVSLIQIKNGFTMEAVIEEIHAFLDVRPWNWINPVFWFWAFIAVVTPRPILRKLPAFYRHRIGRLITREIKRP